MQGKKSLLHHWFSFPKVATFTLTYQMADAKKYIIWPAYSKSGDPNAGLSFAVLHAAIVAHMRWESPAVRYELIVARTVNVVNFDVVRLL